MNTKEVRVRFAPSPTGHLHIGGLRTALFNLLFARHHKGTYLVRIEDTDLERSRPEFTQSILNSLEWADLDPDEPITTQTDFTQHHKELIEQLVAQGNAYKCYCPPSEGEFNKYDGRCRMRKGIDDVQPFVIRIKLPDQESITFNDLIRGQITFAMDQLDDFIIARSDGNPVYNFVVVADDAAMKITQVIRGEDHISNTPKQIIIYNALGLPVPEFAHVPLILNEQGGRLSKRDAATSVLEYKEQGFLPEALCNYLMRLGWAHGDQEIFSRQELIDLFTLEGVGKKGAIFDMQKLKWTNSVYLRTYSAQQLCDYIIANLDQIFMEQVEAWSGTQILQAIELYKERVDTVAELKDALLILCNFTPVCTADMRDYLNPQTSIHLQEVITTLTELVDFEAPTIKESLKTLIKKHNIKLVAIAQPIRLALTGTVSSPGVFDLIALLGKQETIKRLEAFISCI